MTVPTRRSPSALTPLALLLLGASAATAHDVALDGPIALDGSAGYVSAGGSAIRTGGGECLRLGGFSEDTQVNACEGIEEAASEEVAAAPEPEPAAAPAPPPEPVVAEPIVTEATLGGEALFGSGSAELIPASEQALADLLLELEGYQEISAIEVIGHSDSRGDEAFNQQLSLERAMSVRDFLLAAYPDVDITARGEGENDPVATNETPEGRQLNRRVEIQITARSISDS